jgi:hypothetical protein
MDLMTYLGMVASHLGKHEGEVDLSIEIAKLRLEENPESMVIPMVASLLKATKDMIEAQKLIGRYGEMMVSGSVFIDGSETVH